MRWVALRPGAWTIPAPRPCRSWRPTYRRPPSTRPTGFPRTPAARSWIRSDAKTGAIAIGWMGGAGVDMAVLPNLFVRGEWELVHFPKVGGTSLTVNTFRAAAAF